MNDESHQFYGVVCDTITLLQCKLIINKRFWNKFGTEHTTIDDGKEALVSLAYSVFKDTL
jgi:hypothetical protein